MAKKKAQPQNTSSIDTRTFTKGMVKDMNASFQASDSWSHARNAANNSTDGDVGVIGNEPANLECVKIPYTLIGAIHLYSDQWVLYSTDDTNSEIGLFDDSKCEYKALVNDPCLSFNRKHLIGGASKENFDCTWQVYWDDGNNPSRTLNINDIPWKKIIISAPGADCIEYADTTDLDCEQLRLAPLLDTPCVKLYEGEGGGQLRNGSYQAFIAYTVNEQRVTDYIGISNVQSIFDHRGSSGSLKIEISNLDQDFEYYELVILSNNQQEIVPRKVGLYSTQQDTIGLDYLDQQLVKVDIRLLPLRSPAYEKSDAMYVVNDYLIRQGPTEQFDFNYQPLANNIKAKWVVAEYPANYYYKGGNKTSLLRDEQYAFFIRWIYNTGERSSSYHIPGRPPKVSGFNQFGARVDETRVSSNTNALANTEKNFQVFNTATMTPGSFAIPTNDNGLIIAKGEMGYWESSEKYPADRPDIWDDLCGKPIRHHKMPTEELGSQLHLSTPDGEKIRILGVEFENIAPPVDNAGNIITNIVGYELLRGSRLGAMSILAKGIFRNMREYNIPDNARSSTSKGKGLYPNYPYNDLRSDIFFHDGAGIPGASKRTDGCHKWDDSLTKYRALEVYKKDFFTFHSPEVTFKRPAFDAYETRIYGDVVGKSVGNFIPSENHPKFKLLRNSAAIISAVIGVGYALKRLQGTKTQERSKAKLDLKAPQATTGLDPTYAAAYSTLFTAAGTDPLVSRGVYYGVIRPDELANEKAERAAPTVFANILAGDALVTPLGSGEGSRNRTFDRTRVAGGIPYIDAPHEKNTYIYDSGTSNLPQPLKGLLGIPLAAMNASIGANEIIELLYNKSDSTTLFDFVYKHNSHGFYNEFKRRASTNRFRSKNTNSSLLRSAYHEFEGYKVNNLYRPSTTIIKTDDIFAKPSVKDTSRYAMGGDADGNVTSRDNFKNPDAKRVTNISCMYGALKYDFENQYGQLDSINQIPLRGCIELVDIQVPQQKFKSQPIFDGDVYINRYTEKTIMPIFTAFLNGQPDETSYDYLSRINIPYPRFWLNSQRFDTTELSQEIMTLTLAPSSAPLPNDLFYLDRGQYSCINNLGDLFRRKNDPNRTFFMTTAYMYSHINGVQDFFVESKYNLAHRDWEDRPGKRHYDDVTYTEVDELFHADIVKEDNFYLIDQSVNKTSLPTQLATFGKLQTRDYDPLVAEKCYSYYPKRLIYSLRSKQEAKKDFWRVFLPNNYFDFKNKVTVIKPFNKTGAIIFFPYQSPQMFQGVDTLKSTGEIKFILGDGGLFNNQPLQNIVNSDLSNEWGSLESARSVVNTPHGIFYISQAQGKVFQYAGQLNNIANAGMKWWFNKYLPSPLIRQFPELEFSKLSDNPVIGIGCQTVYDPNDNIVYFMKRDYKLKDDYVAGATFFNDLFTITNPVTGLKTNVALGDPLYFEDASWTVSYDPKAKAWISFHDWHPELSLHSINHFLTTKTIGSDELKCPDGYSYNPDKELCEKIDQATNIATNVIDEVLATFDGGSDCNVDVIIAVDTSEATGGFTSGTIGASEIYYVKQVIDNPNIQAAMTASKLQIGIVSHSSLGTISMLPGGDTMTNVLTGSQVETWLQANWQNGGTNVPLALSGADTELNNKAGSALGDRTATTGFKQHIILLTTDIPTTTVGTAYQSSTMGGTASAYQYLRAVYAGGPINSGSGQPIPAGLQNITLTTNPIFNYSIYSNWQVYADNAAFATYTALQCIDTTGEETCNCPPGYTLVYKDSSGNYTESTGTCDPNDPPKCRKITCDCPPTPFTGGSTTSTGVCDDIYLVGDPAYINPTPKVCNYFYSSSTPPSFFGTGIWRHNVRCDLFSNYYGQSYPWEVELIENTGQAVTTLRSIEYQLESYVYKGDLYNGCADDRWHDLDFNFDESIIYNSEQISGLLKLELNPKEDPYGILQYPIIGINDMRILYSKEEQKYRFNQFWDITDDRGEFSGVQRSMFETQPNGYIKDLNALNLNYSKDAFEHKKFRHYYNKVILRRIKSADRKMLLKLANTKLNMSFR